MLIRKNFAVVIIFVMFVSCGHVPETHYYQLLTQPMVTSSPAKMNKIVGVKKFTADAPYDQDRLVYRESPYELKFYNYRRWIAAPTEMLTEHAISRLRASSLFAGVCHANSSLAVDYLLSGRLLQFEEWDDHNVWYAKVKIWAELLTITTRENEWEGYLESSVKIVNNKPLGVVEGLNQAVDDCFTQLLDELSKNLQ